MTDKLDMINRSELFEYIEALYHDHYEQAYDQTVHDIFNAVRRRIRRCQAVKPLEVKHAEWLQGYPIYCSACNGPAPTDYEDCNRYEAWLTSFCPHCGAKMTGGNTVSV